MSASTRHGDALRRVVALVALLNLGYFGVEFAVALIIGSVSLFADSIDFLEDASINLLIFAALGWSAARRARVGMVLAGILLVPGLATLWTAWDKLMAPIAPEPWALSLTGAGALAVNLTCAFLLARFPIAERQPDPRRLSLGPQRCRGEHRHHRRGRDHRHPVDFRLARHHCRPRHRLPQFRRCPGGLGSGAAGAERRRARENFLR